MTSREIGNIGEDFTARFLEEKGCEILARNFCIRGGELDIVAKKGKLIHIVEVKTRRPDPLSGGEQALTPRKISHIVKAAEAFMRTMDSELSCVFDVAVVEVKNGGVTDFKYIQRAFTA